VSNGGGASPGFAAGSSCANDVAFQVVVPAGSPAGRIVIDGWMHYTIAHTNGATDKTRIYVGTTSTDCGSSDSFRSYAVVQSAEPTQTFEGMVPLQVQYTVAAGGGTFSFYVNTQKISGGTFTDSNVNVEGSFRTQG
jgi:hypothetical protein